jgi:hypothetical protein
MWGGTHQLSVTLQESPRAQQSGSSLTPVFFGVLTEIVLQSYGQLNHWPLVINSTVSPFPLPGG